MMVQNGQAVPTVPAPVSGKSRNRNPEADPYARKKDDTDATFAWRQRMATDEGKAIYKERGSLIEPVNGDLAEIRKKFEAVTGKQVDIETQVDAALIGGARAQIGSVIYDGTIKNQLDKMREQHAALQETYRALGMEDRVGSIAPGKLADLAAVDLSAPELAPCYDPLSHLVYAAGREHVTHVWVNGELIVEERRLLRLDPAELSAKAAYWKDRVTH